MPIYEYECPTCCSVFEVFQRMTEDPLTKCPECSGAVKKLVSRSSFQLKGGGWYTDGYSSKASNGSGTNTTKNNSDKTTKKSSSKAESVSGSSSDSSATTSKPKESSSAASS